MATWKVVKAQAARLLGIDLKDFDFNNVPLLKTDAYGNFIPEPTVSRMVVDVGADGIAGTADDVTVEGSPGAPIDLAAVGAFRTGHAFLNDIAHNAVPVNDFGVLPPTPIADSVIRARLGPAANLAYDNELLDAHYMAGDGRVNENIGLTAVHAIFHSEHNRLVEQTKETVLGIGRPRFLNEWLLLRWRRSRPTRLSMLSLEWRTPVPSREVRHRDAIPAPGVRRVCADHSAQRRLVLRTDPGL